MQLMGSTCDRIAIVQVSTDKELAVITDNEITTANNDIVVKIKPNYDSKD